PKDERLRARRATRARRGDLDVVGAPCDGTGTTVLEAPAHAAPALARLRGASTMPRSAGSSHERQSATRSVWERSPHNEFLGFSLRPRSAPRVLVRGAKMRNHVERKREAAARTLLLPFPQHGGTR